MLSGVVIDCFLDELAPQNNSVFFGVLLERRSDNHYVKNGSNQYEKSKCDEGIF